MNTLFSSTSSMASGRRSKNAAPRIDPAEKAIKTNKIECSVFSFRDNAKIPNNESKLIATVEISVLVQPDIKLRLSLLYKED